jgi:CBS domain-containing protein
MSFNDQKAFLQSIHPFDELSETQLDDLAKRIEIGFYPAETSLTVCGAEPDRFYIIIKGEVKALDEQDNVVRVYREKDSFDADALLEGNCDYHYLVSEDLIAYEIDKKSFMKLFEANETFRQFYLMDIVERIEHLKKRERDNGMGEWMTARVSESYWHAPCIVPAETPLLEAVRRSVEMGRSEIIVDSPEYGYGIIADSDLKRLFAEGGLDPDARTEALAHFPLLTVEKEDFLFNAYLELIRKNIKRLGVTEKGRLIGVLEQIDILSYFANHSHLITVKIERARSVEELKEASLGYLTIVRRLYAQGLKSRYIAKLISEINRKLFARLFAMIVPEELQNDCALLVMGSEGRGEQIIRTDQDNALAVRDGVDVAKFVPHMERFSAALLEFGYPPCPGKIMVTNDYWRRDVSGYKKEIERWIERPDEESFMYFSIFFDAETVAGDAALNRELKEYIFSRFDERNDIYMAHFARLALLFETPVGLWSTLLHRDRHVDIKKAGIFPIVQGVRSLALRYRVEELSTVERLKELARREILKESFARELIEAFDTLGILRLGAQLRAIDEEREPDNTIHSDDLSKIQRDLLRDSLEIVERFKGFITRHFELDRLPS